MTGEFISSNLPPCGTSSIRIVGALMAGRGRVPGVEDQVVSWSWCWLFRGWRHGRLSQMRNQTEMTNSEEREVADLQVFGFCLFEFSLGFSAIFNWRYSKYSIPHIASST